MRGFSDSDASAAAKMPLHVPSKTKKLKRTLQDEAIDLLRKESDDLRRELRILRGLTLAHEKKEMILSRRANSAEEASEALLEAVSLFSRYVTGEKREGRKVREEARKILEDRGIPPPHTLGRSRERKKTKRKKTVTTEST